MAAGATPFNSGGTSMRFPTDLGTDDVPNYITFRPELVEYGSIRGENGRHLYGNAFTRPDYTNYTPSVGTLQNPRGRTNGITIFNPFEQIRQRIGGIVDSIANGARLNFDFPRNIGSVNIDLSNLGNRNMITGRLNLGSIGINIGNAARQSPNTVLRLPGINLFLPPELKSAIIANYDQKPLGASGQTAIDFATTPFTGVSEDTVRLVSGLATAAIQDVMSDKFSALLQVGTGRAKNNYTYAIFNGMQHREFSYSFNLIAKNAEETRVIKDICDSFMFYMLPVRSQDDFHFYDVPCMWDISYNRLGQRIEYFDQPKKCFLKNATVAYGGDAFGQTYDDGAPITVKLTLSFMEIEPMLRNDNDRANLRNPLYEQVEGLFTGRD